MDSGLSKSVLDVIEKNFREINSKAFVHRASYVGEHNFDNPEESLKTFFKTVCNDVNSTYCDAAVHGFILIYQKYYICILEGSEESLSRQMRQYMSDKEHYAKFGRAKLLMVYHNINKRIIDEDIYLFTTPPTLATKMNTDVSISNHAEVLETCLKKLDSLLFFVKDINQLNSSTILADVKADCLPEYALLEYILTSSHSIDLREYADMFDTLPDYQYSFEKCWPSCYDFTPRVLENQSLEEVFVESLPEEYDPEQAPKEEEDVEIEEDKIEEEV